MDCRKSTQQSSNNQAPTVKLGRLGTAEKATQQTTLSCDLAGRVWVGGKGKGKSLESNHPVTRHRGVFTCGWAKT